MPLIFAAETGIGRRTRKHHDRFRRANLAHSIPRIARLMALAIRFDGLVREETIQDYAELARLGRVTRARMTQIMKLLFLAPDIQEQILFLPPSGDSTRETCGLSSARSTGRAAAHVSRDHRLS